ncbi:hypothetical protein [Devosia aquimaris]|uniref:hypothetical protein n=1 Tax=Devosia aquimaris TaxID=2866214 RepID=UPI001CD080B2|nr:hypothetical protein [Devosia sp. CJK-A8-3]
MTNLTNKTRSAFRNATRAAVVTLGLGLAAVSVAPVAAQEFSIQMQAGGNGGQGFGDRHHGGHNGGWNNGPGYNMRCLTNREVIRGVSAYGYRNVQIVRELRRDRVEVQAVKRGYVYEMRVDKCTGRVSTPERIGRIGGGHGGFNGGYNNGGSFGFQFNFGN